MGGPAVGGPGLRRPAALIALIAVLGLALAGCSTDPGGTVPSGTVPGADGRPSAQAVPGAAQPVPGVELVPTVLSEPEPDRDPLDAIEVRIRETNANACCPTWTTERTVTFFADGSQTAVSHLGGRYLTLYDATTGRLLSRSSSYRPRWVDLQNAVVPTDWNEFGYLGTLITWPFAVEQEGQAHLDSFSPPIEVAWNTDYDALESVTDPDDAQEPEAYEFCCGTWVVDSIRHIRVDSVTHQIWTEVRRPGTRVEQVTGDGYRPIGFDHALAVLSDAGLRFSAPDGYEPSAAFVDPQTDSAMVTYRNGVHNIIVERVGRANSAALSDKKIWGELMQNDLDDFFYAVPVPRGPFDEVRVGVYTRATAWRIEADGHVTTVSSSASPSALAAYLGTWQLRATDS